MSEPPRNPGVPSAGADDERVTGLEPRATGLECSIKRPATSLAPEGTGFVPL